MSNPELTGRPSALDRKAQALVRAAQPATPQRRSATRKLARGLGWFSIGLGLLELLAARRVARATGLDGAAALLRLYGLREIGSGVGLLAAGSAAGAAPFAWSRVAGDALDLSTLAAAATLPGRPMTRPLMAMTAVAGVTLLDIACARTLQAEASASRQSTDYSDRSGLGGSPESLRGAARRPALESPSQPSGSSQASAP